MITIWIFCQWKNHINNWNWAILSTRNFTTSQSLWTLDQPCAIFRLANTSKLLPTFLQIYKLYYILRQICKFCDVCLIRTNSSLPNLVTFNNRRSSQPMTFDCLTFFLHVLYRRLAPTVTISKCDWLQQKCVEKSTIDLPFIAI